LSGQAWLNGARPVRIPGNLVIPSPEAHTKSVGGMTSSDCDAGNAPQSSGTSPRGYAAKA